MPQASHPASPSEPSQPTWTTFAEEVLSALARSAEQSSAFVPAEMPLVADNDIDTVDDLLDEIEAADATDGSRPGGAPPPAKTRRPRVAVAHAILCLARAFGDAPTLRATLAVSGRITVIFHGPLACVDETCRVLRVMLEHARAPHDTTPGPRIMTADEASRGPKRIDALLDTNRPLVLLAGGAAALDDMIGDLRPETVHLPALDAALLRMHLQWRYGADMPPELDLPDAAGLAAADIRALQLALRAPTPAGAVRALSRETQAGDDAGSLSAFPLPQEVRDVLLGLVDDLREWHAGRLDWAQVPRGLLLTGPPGGGKTEIARLLAAEAGMHVHAGSMAQWMSSGARSGDVIREMRQFFAAAGDAAPAVVFIDELDAIGSREAQNGPNTAWVQGNVAALLELLDGFAAREGVVVMAATNAPDRIDPALRRPGRFDRTLTIDPPTPELMPDVLRWHVGPDLSGVAVARLARRAPGLSGAAIAAIVRRARARARAARRELQEADLAAEIESEAPPLTDAQRWRIALHEAGHAVVSVSVGLGRPVRMMIAHEGGLTQLHPAAATGTERDVAARLASLMAGRAAERLELGAVSWGAGGAASSDLAEATRLAVAAERSFGLGPSPVWHGPPDTVVGRLSLEPDLRRTVDARLRAGETQAAAVLRANHAQFLGLARALFDQSVLSGETLETALDGVGPVPVAPDTTYSVDGEGHDG